MVARNGVTRRYQPLPDAASCTRPECPFASRGEAAEALAEQHTASTGHQTQVLNGGKAIFALAAAYLETDKAVRA